MKKAQTSLKTKQHLIAQPIFWISTLAVVLSSVDLVQNYLKSQNDQVIGNNQLQNSIRQAHDHSRLLFCYEHNVKPCDNIALHEYNATVQSESDKYVSFWQNE